ncbi:MAG: RES family NAD+ phosphorylase [Flavobacterium sp. JAD_PAG50586_2]|nr:MAG: RES family NAD+ phosphorylase [Flavobacterium sp. JAD_PAG50586_2]
MPNVCKDCFSDKELKGFINSQSIKGNCDFCENKDIEILEISELFDFFKELLDNFKKVEEGDSLKSKIQGNWSLFATLDSATKILNFIIDKIDTELASSDDIVEFNDDILENINYWDILKEQLIWETRYLTDINHITELGWDGFFNTQIILNKTTDLYRARLHNVSSDTAYQSHEMFCPPKHISTAGRANPSGIPYLYLSDNSETILYEIRASYLDEVSIGTFRLNEGYNNIFIADFTENPTIFHPSKVNDKIKSTLLKQKISADLSKPMRRYDSELDYIPTQFICEFIKVYTGVHGIKFRSSLHRTGNNIVIFDQNLMQCTSIQKVKVKKVVITT